ncbi:uncharacterized protein LACBIDRAFT_310866 [Laccaria bicolor S238N-H82]|uniref:Predicted protein n=1 Tax=Laccaria bicolor (strain S238N-H82 / ATCC MYA-4686) TaxID=486041 RepID=B0DV97_LACBS|nr:uncharacterized protein LACBIDRAFT_310866 [Laccaria bicolor S238N-H82]EDR01474.1 predicted protein [Laccaria bicolor S238N-H82]|eukprot:XP_001887826.1 predicted protein [Laccaria bicolor S238N-H82]
MQSSRSSMQPPSYQSTVDGRIESQGPNSNSSCHQVSSNFGRGGNFSNRARSAEREPLLRQRSASSPRRRSWSPKPALLSESKITLIFAALALFIIGLLLGSTITYSVSTDHLDPIVRDRIRAKWEIEVNQHSDLH